MFDLTSVIKIESIRKGSDSLEMSNLPSRTLAAIWVKSLKQVPMDSLVSFFAKSCIFKRFNQVSTRWSTDCTDEEPKYSRCELSPNLIFVFSPFEKLDIAGDV